MNNVIGWVITDQEGNRLLMEPTFFELFGEEVILPLAHDLGSYTVFRTETALNESIIGWENFMKEMKYHVVPLIGKLNESCIVEDFST